MGLGYVRITSHGYDHPDLAPSGLWAATQQQDDDIDYYLEGVHNQPRYADHMADVAMVPWSPPLPTPVADIMGGLRAFEALSCLVVSDAERAMLLADLEKVKREQLMAIQARTRCLAETVEIKEN